MKPLRSRFPLTRPLLVGAIAALLVAADATAAVRVTGYAAASKVWAAHHAVDPDPSLQRGCCYLPRQADGTDRYYAVFRQHGRVMMYSMHFAPRVTAKTARRILLRTELPSDAKLVRSKHAHDCLILEYRSPAAKRVLGTAKFAAALYSSDTGRYNGRVQDIIIGEAMGTQMGC